MIARRVMIAGLVAATVAVPAAFLAGQDARADTPDVFARRGVAIGGVDPVAYFTQGRAAEGRAEHSLMWKGVEWRFSSAEHRAAFEADPEAYAPQYGGYCAYAVSEGYTAKIDPEAWTNHDGRLYLNYSRSVRDRWSRDIPGRIARGDANWPGVLSR